MNAAECHYRLKALMETQGRLLQELIRLNTQLGHLRAQDLSKIDMARIHMNRALTELNNINIDVEQVLHIALAQEVEDKHARASELK
jgi:Fic family protein